MVGAGAQAHRRRGERQPGGQGVRRGGFLLLQKEVPGFFFFIGCTPPDKNPDTAAPNHSPRFYVDEACLGHGMKLLSGLALDWLAANA